MSHIPESILVRTPLMQEDWMPTIELMRENPDAPKWNIEIGDRVTAEDLVYVREFNHTLTQNRTTRQPKILPESILNWIESYRTRSHYFAKALEKINPGFQFSEIPIMERDIMQRRLAELIPQDENLDRLIINPTSGTSGEPIKAPSHPKAISCYDPMIQFALKQYGIEPDAKTDKIAAVQLCYQNKTIVYHTVHSYLNGAGFAKVNLKPSEWPGTESSDRFLHSLKPVFLSGDPVAFIEMLKQGITYSPRAFLSTALELSPGLREQLEKTYHCPVINWYSLNETGPIGYSPPENPSLFQQLPTDLYIEAVDPQGKPVPEGTEGEILVTGGRNPYLPLLRYRTGDRGAIIYKHTYTRDPMPLIQLSTGRKVVLYKTPDGQNINPVDISRILRKHTIYQHQCIQHPDFSITLRIDSPVFQTIQHDLEEQIKQLFHHSIPVKVLDGVPQSNHKINPYIIESE